ncbi:uncharacterized protein C2orf81 homolog isoform X1 [Octopus sinensis]|uniref:Uncharacterized protein C2orf81 homolog isoform X1 n=1 Tax=Octopus sinensis TaxID=2607531 RepID=A0A6P7SD26_9MOLL|nr:uncharacterized protein C2orf81 homolog isoform X1 [Octopus sinensis]XP_029643332.1 uncharacterized protein C2orf81 homolog isoform X1 [Octopus sinensis]
MQKQRGERKQAQIAHQVIVQPEIVPGKLSEQQWLEFQEGYKNEEFASEIVDDIVNIVLTKAYEIYLERQLLPYTVNAAIEALTLLVEWNFLRRDESQVSPILQPGWISSEESARPEIDNWAPRHYCEESRKLVDSTVRESVSQEEAKDTEAAVAKDEAANQHEAHGTENEHHSPKRRKMKPPKSSGVKDIKMPLKYSNTSLKQTNEGGTKTSKPEKYPRTMTKTSLQSSIGSQAEKEEVQEKILQDFSMAKKQLKESQKSVDCKDVILDSDGNIVGMSKLDPDQLPSNRVRVKYHIQECSIPKKVIKPTKSFKYPENKMFSKYIFRRPQQGKLPKKNSHFGTSEYVLSSNFLSLMESIELVPGVKIKDDKTTKSGPKIREPTDHAYNEDGLNRMENDIPPTENNSQSLDRKTALPENFCLPPITSNTSFHKPL